MLGRAPRVFCSVRPTRGGLLSLIIIIIIIIIGVFIIIISIISIMIIISDRPIRGARVGSLLGGILGAYEDAF